jgi:hypothetical protein
MSTTTELRIAEARTLPHVQRLRSGYHYFRLGKVKGRLPGMEGSPEYFAEHERLLAIAENRAPEPPRSGRPVRVRRSGGFANNSLRTTTSESGAGRARKRLIGR